MTAAKFSGIGGSWCHDESHTPSILTCFSLPSEATYGTLACFLFPLLTMWSLDTLAAINAEIEAEAKQQNKGPYHPSGPEEIETMEQFPFPNLGHIPNGWEQTESFWIDKTGLGRSSEPALTIDEFRSLLYDHVADNPDDSFAITEEGQFQLVVSALRRIRSEISDQLSD